MDAHEDYLKKIIKNTDAICGFVVYARNKNPGKPLLESACKFTKHIQELLVYVSQTCPSFTKHSEKLVAVTPMNKVKKVRFSKPLTSSSNIHKQVESSKMPSSNTPVLPSIGLKSSNSASCPDCSQVSRLRMLKTYDRESLSAHELQLMQSSQSCVKCLDLDAELLKSQNAYNDFSKSYSQLEKHCISLELTMQFNQENFENDSLSNNQNALEILEYFENNDLKAQLQAKDTTICNLKEHIKSMRENNKEEKVKYEMDEIETINIEFEHSVAKLLFKNKRLNKEIEQLKKIYKDQFVSIKKKRALSKEHCCPDCSLVSEFQMMKTYDRESLSAHELHQMYSVEGLGYNLFSVGKFCDANLEVAFRKNTCFIRNLEGVDLLSGSRDVNLYIISLDDMLKTSPIYLLSEASNTKIWLWHRIKESSKTPHFHDDPLHESFHEDSTSQGSSSNVRPFHTLFELIGRWTKDHLIENVIKDPSRSVSIRKQLETDAMWCYFDAFLTFVEPKNFKQAMTEPSWIDEMQEEIHEFERLQV
uniref:Integrase, catalytic region, zinc finger, CCHC-type, peptidase aspartic, catalytic n=1 Tax=Tanacetum cinerariifolium TaxID=118510 RepID=A0A6L2JD58_TANCI|nr:integrase, catalytic region, zinc finger, CCHC-type, peptidase aspartic, catalytic [Tanacetum cinerariifolium]